MAALGGPLVGVLFDDEAAVVVVVVIVVVGV